ncbi:MAG: sialate O-acetylesterase, partial [Planctomycetota bacterium]
MKITSGASDNQLFQRNIKTDKAAIKISGICVSSGAVSARLKGKKAWQKVGTAVKGKWQAEIKFLQTGGPYTVEIKAGKENCTLKNILVGDTWILAGQSNMEGDGRWKDPEKSSRYIRMLDFGGNWREAVDPLHQAYLTTDKAHNFQQRVMKAPKVKRLGLGMSFAARLYKETKIPIALVPSAKGATTMDQWSPKLKSKGGFSLYGSLFKRLKKHGQENVRGILWYQGESDATEEHAPLYKAKMKKLIKAFRKDLGNPKLPFLYAQIGRVLSFENDPNLDNHSIESWKQIQLSQLELESSDNSIAMSVTADLELDNKIHISREALRTVGYRFADIALCKCYGRKDISTGPRIKKVTPVKKDADPWLEVTFSGHNKTLLTQGRPAGFTAYNKEGNLNPVINFKITAPNKIRIRLHEYMQGGTLWYSRNIDSYCNVIDKKGL